MRKTILISALCVACLSLCSTPASTLDAGVDASRDVVTSDVEADAYHASNGHELKTRSTIDVEDTIPRRDELPDVNTPKTEEIGGVVETLSKSWSSGSWVIFSLAVTQLLMYLFKRVDLTRVIIKEHGSLVITVLSSVAGVLSMVVSGANWSYALTVFAFTAFPTILHDIAHKVGLLEHRHDTSESE